MWLKNAEGGTTFLPWLVDKTAEMAWTVKSQPRTDGESLFRDVYGDLVVSFAVAKAPGKKR